MYADERMFTFTGGEPPELEALRRRYARLAVGTNDEGTEQWCNWIVRPKGHGDPVGAMQATVPIDRSTAWVAWEIAVTQWGHGYAIEAATAMVSWLRELGVARIAASIHPEHAASASVARRLGLVATDVIDDGEAVWELLA